jgi:hypothetical protein
MKYSDEELGTIIREAQEAMRATRPTAEQLEAVGRFTSIFTPDVAAELFARRRTHRLTGRARPAP